MKAVDVGDGTVGSRLLIQDADKDCEHQAFFIDRDGFIRSKAKKLVLDISG
jgi:hypothetical protein